MTTQRNMRRIWTNFLVSVTLVVIAIPTSSAWVSVVSPSPISHLPGRQTLIIAAEVAIAATESSLRMSITDEENAIDATEAATAAAIAEVVDYEIPDDAVINIKPRAMRRLRELKQQQSPELTMILRMGVRNGGCSGMSYVMDFSTESEITEEDAVDEYIHEGISCVVDAKSLLYLYGLELDFSDQLIGGGFKFFNPNAEVSCGCGSSFGV